MNRRSKIAKRLRLSKETLRTLDARDLALAAGGGNGVVDGTHAGGNQTYTVAGSLSGSRKCHTIDCDSWTC